MSKKLGLTFGYNDTDFTRKYQINDVPATLSAATIKTNIKGVNASLAGGTDDGLSAAFRADDFNASAGIGAFTGIVAAQLVEQTVTNIPLDNEEEEG